MEEKKLVFVWYERFEKLNKGTLRILAIISILGLVTSIMTLIILMLQEISSGNSSPQENVLGAVFWILMTAFFYWVFWAIVRVGLWIYDGFKESS